MTLNDIRPLLAAGALAATVFLTSPEAASAQESHDHQAPAPAASPSHEHDQTGHLGHAGMIHSPLMERARTLGSGTSLLPQASPMRMWSVEVGEWLWMFHSDAALGLNRQSGPRGVTTWAAENWAMAMGSRPLGPGILDLRLMGSLEPWTLPAGGTPQLFQSGETYLSRPLLDKQHPHDLFIELAGRYTWNLADQTSLFLYSGLVGEPALGPVAFMHRPSSADNHWAPLGHHLQDSTHIAMGVGTVGLRQGPLQVEGSLFNGTEPDENRADLEFGPWSSWATRVSLAPSRHWTAQVSYGQLKNPERLVPGDVHRTTASIQNVQDFSWGYWSNALVWGQNKEYHEGEQVLQSYAAESQVDWDQVNHAYGRLELVDKTGLNLGGDGHDHSMHRVLALTIGGVRDLDNSDLFDLGLGADATVYSLDQETRAVYGENPLSFRVYLRLRPPTM